LNLGDVVIRMINTSSKTLEDMLQTYKYKKESKTQGGNKPERRLMKNLRVATTASSVCVRGTPDAYVYIVGVQRTCLVMHWIDAPDWDSREVAK
jgi:hypothetical protein